MTSIEIALKWAISLCLSTVHLLSNTEVVELIATGGCGGTEYKLGLDSFIEEKSIRAVEPLNQAL